MAKKRKSRASQPSQSPTTEEPPQQQQQEEDPIKQEDEQMEEEEQQQPADEQEEDNENDDVEEEPEEEDDEEEAEEEENDVEEDVKIETNNGDVTEDLPEEPVEKLLEPFSKEQLVLLMKEAVNKYPDLITSVEKIADADPAHRKIFVHGLGWDTTTETLINEYEKYGEIEDCKAVVDKVSGKSKGYGFILFKKRIGAKKALKEPQKKIGNRVTSCQLASAGPVPAPPPVVSASGTKGAVVSEYTQRKIFVSNVAQDIDPAKLTEFFAKFGEIEEGPLGLDKLTGKPKGFALFVYKSIDSAKKALEEPHKIFEGHTLNVQKAIDGPKPVKGSFGAGGGHHHQGGYGSGGHHHSKKAKYSGMGSSGGQGHLMAPSGPGMGFNPGVPPPGALTPVLGQALTALLASQGAVGIGNLLGGLGAANPQGSGYGNQGGAGYQQGGYPQMGQGGRPQQGGGSYMGQGH
nr:UBP1-associated protein 2A-like [Tanacetum cinerariifolium]